MSIQKPVKWSDIQDMFTNDVSGSTSVNIGQFRDKLVYDTQLSVGRNLPSPEISANDFINTVPYQNTTVKPPQFRWQPLGTPVVTKNYDSGKVTVTFYCTIAKPAENASWGNSMPGEMTASVLSTSDSDVDLPDIGCTVNSASSPGGGTTSTVTVKITVPTNRMPLTRRYQVDLNLTYIYPTNFLDPNWRTNPLSQGIENFDSQSPTVRIELNANSSAPQVKLVNRSTNQTNTSATVIRYENNHKPDVNTTKEFGRPYKFDAIIPGRSTGYTNIGTVWELVDSDISYTITYYPYNPNLQQDGNPVSSTTIANETNVNPIGSTGYRNVRIIPGSHSVTTTYDTVLGYGATTSRLNAGINALYRNKATGEEVYRQASITVNGGSHMITKSFIVQPTQTGAPPPPVARLLSIDSVFERKADLRSDRSGVMEYDDISYDLVFENAGGKTFNLYIQPGVGGFYVSGISTGPYGVPQFSPSIMRTYTIPSNNRITVGPAFVATGTGKKWIGNGTVAVMVEYIEDGKGQARWAGTEPPAGATGSITGFGIEYAGQGLLNQGLNTSYRGSSGSGAVIQPQIVNGSVSSVKIVNGGSGYKIGDKFSVTSLSFGGQIGATIKVTSVGGVNIDMSPDARLHTTQVVDKPAGNFRGQLKRNTTVFNEGDTIDWFVIAENLGPDQQRGFWAHSFPGDAVAVTPGQFDVPYVGSGTGYRYNGSLATLNRPNHYEDVTGGIQVYWLDNGNSNDWWDSGTLTLKNVHTTTVTTKPDPQPTGGDLNFIASNRLGLGPGQTAEITASGSISFNSNGTFTKRLTLTGGQVNSSNSTGTAVSPSPAGTDWTVRITPGSAKTDYYNEADVDFSYTGPGTTSIGNFTRSVYGGGSSFTVSLIGERVRWREAQVGGSCTWEMFNTVSKEVIPGGSITGQASIMVTKGSGGPPINNDPVIVNDYCEILLYTDVGPSDSERGGDTFNLTEDYTESFSFFGGTFNGPTGYRIYEWSDGTTTRERDDSCLTLQTTTQPPTTTQATITQPPIGDETWCLEGNRYKNISGFPFVVLVKANDPTCEQETTRPPTTTQPTTTPPTTTVDPLLGTFCDPNTGHRVKLVGDIFSGFTTQVVVFNDPTCAVATTTAPPPTTRRTTTTPPPTTAAGPTAGTIVPGTETCFNGWKFWSEYTGIGFATIFKSQENHPDCVVATTTQPPITTTRTTRPPTTTRKTITNTWCGKNAFGVNSGLYVELYSDGTKVTTYRPDLCPLPTFTTAPPTTRPPTTTRQPITTRRPPDDFNRDPLRRTDRSFRDR